MRVAARPASAASTASNRSSTRSSRRAARCDGAARNLRSIRTSFAISSPKGRKRPAKRHARHWKTCAARCICAPNREPGMKPELTLVASNDPAPPLPAAAAPEQVEMSFAVVNGEPVRELPRDLYIPPQALEVFLEAFEGPLDLLLYLIRRRNLAILDIPIAEITRQYVQYIELMQVLQLELAGEYLVMAATLAEIKSRMLLPRPPLAGEEAGEDPRAELVRRLQEYERFKSAAENIDRLPRLE